MSESRQYMLMEVVVGGPKFESGFDSWLCPWRDFTAFLIVLMEDAKIDTAVNIKFTVLEMTDDEHAAYCDEHGIEWE